jgi:hypothetical protein
VTGDPVAVLLDKIRAAHPGWTVAVHPLGLGLWTAEHRSDDGRSVHYVVCHTGDELAGRLAIVDQDVTP